MTPDMFAEYRTIVRDNLTDKGNPGVKTTLHHLDIAIEALRGSPSAAVCMNTLRALEVCREFLMVNHSKNLKTDVVRMP